MAIGVVAPWLFHRTPLMSMGVPGDTDRLLLPWALSLYNSYDVCLFGYV